jgi:hypothetical protein
MRWLRLQRAIAIERITKPTKSKDLEESVFRRDQAASADRTAVK